ncbi:hypothetical protein SPRG_21964 [Saprolegnia parasitica CBS 223.65]|uniref:Uncharacterized protein n=1 Tax=Saprolegnia parasitica (strain CBS 223.65) TaxID=695850 RepID=A0A067BPZ1_SAPPC|nr:hypothetical protein SPRG_21964 [Saprolegnia parasitica CBS 223.65]KDO16727.1 hypothetical protein SPRG_21964 [Saprolegnia parasitica CBS 223.65]|eukprot:XP_012212563.1 hypothetical protein SPRG_21964 [Saprolegnia parasitica CBS 223.65]
MARASKRSCHGKDHQVGTQRDAARRVHHAMCCRAQVLCRRLQHLIVARQYVRVEAISADVVNQRHHLSLCDHVPRELHVYRSRHLRWTRHLQCVGQLARLLQYLQLQSVDLQCVLVGHRPDARHGSWTLLYEDSAVWSRGCPNRCNVGDVQASCLSHARATYIIALRAFTPALT